MRWNSLLVVVLVASTALLFPQENAEAQCRQLFPKRVVQQAVYKPYVQAVVAQPYVQSVQTYTQPYVQTYVQPYVQNYENQAVRYFLGEDIQAEALAEKLAPKIAVKLVPLMVTEMQRRGLFDGTPVPDPPRPHDPPPVNDGGLQLRNMPVFSAKCAKCHTGVDPASGHSFDNGLTDRQFRKFVLMFRSAKDVPKGMAAVVAGLTPEQKGAITEEVGDFYLKTPAENGGVLPPPKPEPVPEPEGVLR